MVLGLDCANPVFVELEAINIEKYFAPYSSYTEINKVR